jgi:hypothetical protein
MTEPYELAQIRAIETAINAVEDSLRQYRAAQEKATPFKSMLDLAKSLRRHAYNYALEDGALRGDLIAAANYLEAWAND